VCAASSRILATTPRRCRPQPKISKTTPCKVAGGRRQGRFGGQYLTRRANQRHSFIIAQSVKRPWARNGAPFGVFGRKSLPTIEVAMALEVAMARRSVLPPPRFRRACRGRRWSGSGLPCDHGHTSCRARATRRYAANDGARNVDFECFLGSNGTRPLHKVPLQCHPKQCADRHLRPRRPGATSSVLSCRHLLTPSCRRATFLVGRYDLPLAALRAW
jgi:hypothetical protein